MAVFTRIYNVNDHFFDEIGESQAWLLGLLASDGNVNDTHRVSISQSGKGGLRTIKYIKGLLETNARIISYEPKLKGYHCNTSYGMGFTSKPICEKLSEFGIIPRKSLIYKYPTETLPNNLFLSFIRGYIDGDGSVSVCDNGRGSKYLQISYVGTRDFVEQSSQYFDIKPGISKIKAAKNCYCVYFTGKKAYEIGKQIYSLNAELYTGQKYKAFKKYSSNIMSVSWFKIQQRRLKAIEFFKKDISVMEIASMLDESFQTVYEWRNRFRDGEIDERTGEYLGIRGTKIP